MSSRALGTVLVLSVATWACGGGDAAADGGPSGAGGNAPPASAAPPETGGNAGATLDLPEGVTGAMVDRGRELFNGAGSCFACHGQDGTDGQLAPDLTDDDWLNVDGTYPAIIDLINTGVEAPREFPGIMLPRAGMPLSDEDVAALAGYVWSLANTDM